MRLRQSSDHGPPIVAVVFVVAVAVSGVGPAAVGTASAAQTTLTATDTVGFGPPVAVDSFVVDNNTTDSLVDQTNDTIDTINNTTDTVNETTDETIDTVGGTTNETTATLDDTLEATNNTTSTVGETVETVENTTSETADDLSDSTGSLDEWTLLEGTTTTGSGGNTTAPLDEDTSTPSSAAPSYTGPSPYSSTAPFPDGIGGAGSVPAAVAVGAGLAIAGAAVRTGLAGGLLAGAPAIAPEGLRMTVRGAIDRVIRSIAPMRYSRWDDSDPLEHEGRAGVFEVIEGSPGIYLTAVSERTDVPLSTLRHHVRVLERENLIAGATVRGRRRFYPANRDDVELAAALNDEATAPIIDALARLGPTSVSALADAVERDVSTVTHHLQRLEEGGLVQRTREGREIANRLAPDVHAALAPVEPESDRPIDAPVSAD